MRLFGKFSKVVLAATLTIAGVFGPTYVASAFGMRRQCASACYVPCYQTCYQPCYTPPPCSYYYVVSYWDCYRCCWVYYGSYWDCWEAQRIVNWLRCSGWCATYACYPYYPVAQAAPVQAAPQAVPAQAAPQAVPAQAAPAPAAPAPAEATPAPAAPAPGSSSARPRATPARAA